MPFWTLDSHKVEQNVDAGSYFRGGLSLACPLPVGKEILQGLWCQCTKGSDLLTSISMPPLLIGTCELWEDMKLCLVGTIWGGTSGRYLSLSILKGPLKQ